jgi:hypothetical protein
MTTPFIENGYTDQEADAIHRALIEAHLKPDIRWDHLREEITSEIRAICTRASVLYTGDIQRHVTTMETALEAFLKAYDHLSEAERFHLERQGCDSLPIVDDETALRVRSTIDALLGTVRQARRRPFDAPYALEQARGAPTNLTMVLLVTHFLYVFERVTWMVPTVYFDQHADDDHNGTAYAFLLSALVPLKLLPQTQLPSAIRAAYRQAKSGMQATRDQLDALKHQA